MSTQEELEHWRLRLAELAAHMKAARGMNRRAVADQSGIAPDYLSRLLYEPEKKGRKNLGMDTMRKICAGFDLPPNWFDLPLGVALPRDEGTPSPPLELVVREPAAGSKAALPHISWPFPQVTYRRVQDLKSALGPKLGHEAMADIGKTLDVVVTKWEREILERKRRS